LDSHNSVRVPCRSQIFEHFSVTLHFCSNCLSNAGLYCQSRKRLAKMIPNIRDYSGWMLINVFHEKFSMSFSQLVSSAVGLLHLAGNRFSLYHCIS
jgi:hypothetical protein